MISWILERMAEAIVISTESDADDLSKGSVKVRNATSEGIVSFFSVLPAGELPRPSHTAPGRPRKATTKKRPVGQPRKLPAPAESNWNKITRAGARVMIKKLKS